VPELERVYHEDNKVRVTVSGTTVTFSSRVANAACVLNVAVSGESEAAGSELVSDAEGRKIVRVQRRGGRVSLHKKGQTLYRV
jgi:formamidopyrimidine-DNA glycosylase